MTELPQRQSAWMRLKSHTPARIGMGRAGAAVTTQDHLKFRLDHAQARDAVHAALDANAIAAALEERKLKPLLAYTRATDRAMYLVRPDLGRQLAPESAARLGGAGTACDLAIVIADGLSAHAVHRQALPLLDAVLPRLAQWRIGPVVIVVQGRVAIGDEIGAAFGASLAAVLIGERPGLSSPDSLGVYITWNPRPGRVDAERNCISNIRPEGLGYAEAAARLAYLLESARARRMTGVALKDETVQPARLSTLDGR